MLDRYLNWILAATRDDWRLALDKRVRNVVVKLINTFRWHLIEISYPNRIGHLCIEVDSYLKDMILRGKLPGRVFLTKPDYPFANDTVIAYFKQRLTVTRSRFLRDCFKLAGRQVPAITRTHPYAVAMYKTARAFDVYARWGHRPPLFRLSGRDRRFGEAMLRRMGVPAGAWFVCVHARSAGYSPTDDALHTFRNMDIEDFGLAIDEITARGGWCIRVGDATMKPMLPRANVVDYALSSIKSARMDVFLAARCRFFLGSNSGPLALATMFGQPAALVNLAPLSASYSYGPDDLSIVQRVRMDDGRLPSFAEIMGGPIANLRLADEFDARGISLIQASPEEIRELVLEMIERLEGRAIYTPEDEARQAGFRSLFHDGHHGYKACSRVGRDFLRRHMTE
jgi:putative glycosyltransferase (TIGR04372 family)